MKPELSINTRKQLLNYILKEVCILDLEKAKQIEQTLTSNKCFAFRDENNELYTIVTNLTLTEPYFHVTLCKMKPVEKPP